MPGSVHLVARDRAAYELAERMTRRAGPKVGLVAVTGYGQPEDRQRSREAGFLAHLVKPIDRREL